MKIQIASDLHLEFVQYANRHYEHITKTDADVLILAGDIQVGVGKQNSFFQDMLSHYKDVIYIAGNHEYYNHNFHNLRKLLPQWASAMNDVCSGNFHYLDDQSIMIDDVLFIGATLWTDFNKHDFGAMRAVQGALNDFRIIKKTRLSAKTGKPKTDRFTPQDAYDAHKISLNFIATELIKPGKKVVITHMAPSEKSIESQYIGDIINYGYFTALDEYVDQSNLWFHGHMHKSADYMRGKGRVILNPRGYVGHATNPNYKLDFVVEI